MYLIDTHILLWALVQPNKLSAKEEAVLTDSSQKIFVSIATVWEIAIKIGIKKLSLPPALQNNLQEGLVQAGFDILPLDFKSVWTVQDLSPYHNDPFDRLIIATAQLHKLTVITRDKIFKKYPITLL